MSSSFVWAQLYYQGKDKAVGNPFEIRPTPEDVADLAEAVKDKRAVALKHCASAYLSVYSPGTTSPLSEQTPIRGDKKLADLIDELERDSQSVSIDYDHPLVVVAPAPAPQGTQLSGSLFFMVEFIQVVLG